MIIRQLIAIVMLAGFICISTVGYADSTNGADSPYGSISTNANGVGGEEFAVNSENGILSYSFNLFQGSVNYAQTPFTLALALRQTAMGSYVGKFKGSNNNPIPYGVSAYLPVPAAEATLNGSYDDAGAVWDIDLPAIFISTSQISKFYGNKKIAATVYLKGDSYTYLMTMPNISNTTNPANFVPAYTNALTAAGQQGIYTPSKGSGGLYNQEAKFMTFTAVNGDSNSLVIQDKDGVNYKFSFAVLYGYQGTNNYQPGSKPDGSDATADEVLIYRIASITYPNGQSLNFSYSDNFAGNITTTITDTSNNTGAPIAKVVVTGQNGSVSVLNQKGQLANIYNFGLDGFYRLASLTNATNTNINWGFTHTTIEGVPYSWNNQTTLSAISNNYTGQSIGIQYDQYNINNTYDAGCNEIHFANIAVQEVTNTHANQILSQSTYSYGYESSLNTPNFVIPQSSGAKTYGSGLSHWLDNIFVANNQDDNGCSSNDAVAIANISYSTTINTTYAGNNQDPRNSVQTFTYDALGRILSSQLSRKNGQTGQTFEIFNINYSYAVSVSDVGKSQPYSDFYLLPLSFASPSNQSNSVNTCWLNSIPVGGPNLPASCNTNSTQSWLYDNAGNKTKYISTINQETDYTYLSSANSSPPYERFPLTTTTYGLVTNGQGQRSSIVLTKTYQNLAIAPSGSGAIANTTLPIASQESHFDMNQPQNGTYSYLNQAFGYLGGSQTAALNGYLTSQQQTDGTGISDVSQFTTNFTPNLVSLGGQSAMMIGSMSSGQSGSTSTSQNNGQVWINRTGFLLQSSNTLGQVSSVVNDSYSRLTASTTLAGTPYAQTTSYVYDQDMAICASPCSGAMFSIRQTDQYGNLTYQLFDYRYRPIATYQKLVGSSGTVLIQLYTIDDAFNVVTRATQYGNGYSKTVDYYYSPGTQQIVAAVPNVGTAQGQIIDFINGNTFTFRYVPASGSPTQIQQLVGSLSVTHLDKISGLKLYEGTISLDNSTKNALQGLDILNWSGNANLASVSGLSLWLAAGNASGLVPSPLSPLYQLIGQHAPSALTAADHLLSFNEYAFDEWNAVIGVDNYSFPNNGNGTPSTVKKTTTYKTDNAQRSNTMTYPQGQQQTSVFNMLGGMQSSYLKVGGITTVLGSMQHDGLGRTIQFNDSLNGPSSKSLWTFTGATGLLSSATDALGNKMSLSYSAPLYKPVQVSYTPVSPGVAVSVNKAYDRFGRATTISDSLGNTYSKTYLANGLLGSSSTRRLGQSTAYKTSLSYDAYGELTAVSDPFLPIQGSSSGGSCTDQVNPSSNYGYAINRDSYGRLSQVTAQNFYGVALNFSYDPNTSSLTQSQLSNLPVGFVGTCNPQARLSIVSQYGYDDYLRPVSKSVTLGNPNPQIPAQFTQTYDLAGLVVATSRQDMAGKSLSESYGYDPITGALTTYQNSGNATPYGYNPADGPIQGETYSYDLYGNLTALADVAPGGAQVMQRQYFYDNNNPFKLIGFQETRPSNVITRQYTYNAAGNVLTDGFGRQFGYNGQGLISAIRSPNGQLETISYDGLGHVSRRQLSTGNTVSNTIIQYGSAQLASTPQGNNQPASNQWLVKYLGGRLTYQISGGNQAVENIALAGVSDLGSRTINTLQSSAQFNGWAVVNNNSFTPYGVMTNLIGGNTTATAGYPALLANATAYPESGFGKVQGREVNSGLMLLGSYRSYDPVLGRFLQMDSYSPFGAGGLNGYAYAMNNPVSYFDPSGHYAQAKVTRYGKKPPSAHKSGSCSSGVGGFLGGLLDGACKAEQDFVHGQFEQIMDVVGAYRQLFTGNFKGFLRDEESAFVGHINQMVNTLESPFQHPGGALGTLMFEEMNLKPSNVFKGKNPYHRYHVSSYEAGYTVGGAVTADTLALVIMLVTDSAADALENAAWEAEDADAPVMTQAQQAAMDNNANAENFASQDNESLASEEPEPQADDPHIPGEQSDENGNNGEADNNPQPNKPPSHPNRGILGRHSAKADFYKLTAKTLKTLDNAHSILDLLEEGSNQHQPEQSSEPGNTPRTGFGQINLNQGYSGPRVNQGTLAPSLNDSGLFGTEKSGTALQPPTQGQPAPTP